MSIIIPFDTGWTITQHMIDKLINLILLWSWICCNIVITRFHSSVNYVYDIVWYHLPNWKSTPPVRRDKNRHRTSHGAGKFLRKLCGSKKSSNNKRNCESGRHNRRHTFLSRKPSKICQDTNTTCLHNMDLKIKTNNDGETKFPPPCRQDQMICAIHRRQVAEHLESTY